MFATDGDYREMLVSVRWRKLRAWKLAFNPCCEECERNGLAVAAVEVHHVRPVLSLDSRREREALMFDPSNLAALCHDCHVEAHRRLGKWQVRKWDKAEAARRRKVELSDFAAKFGLKTGNNDGDGETGAA